MACNNPLCPECKACHTDHVCKHCKVPVCSICCFQRGLEGEFICNNCFSSKSTSQSGDTNTAATPASTSPTPVTAAASALPSPPLIHKVVIQMFSHHQHQLLLHLSLQRLLPPPPLILLQIKQKQHQAKKGTVPVALHQQVVQALHCPKKYE